jgi:hypothetical protein
MKDQKGQAAISNKVFQVPVSKKKDGQKQNKPHSDAPFK